MSRSKRLLRNIHLWLGLVSALPILISCLTGSILVFRPEIESFIHRKEVQVAVQSQRLDYSQLLNDFRNTYHIAPSRLYVPAEEDKAIRVYARDREQSLKVNVYMNPYTGAIIGEKKHAAEEFFETVEHLHRWWLVKEPGETIVAISTFFFFLLCLTGLVIWLPSKLWQLKKRLTIDFKAKKKALVYQLHTGLSIYAFVLLLIISFSGLYISQKWFENSVTAILGGEGDSKKEIVQATEEQTAGFDAVFAQINELLPYPSKTIVIFSDSSDKPSRFYKYKAGWLGMRQRERVSYQATTRTFEVQRFSNLSLAEQYHVINETLHMGGLFGTYSRVLFFVAVLIGAVLTITGFLIWWYRQKGNKKKSANKAAVTVSA